MIIMICLWIFDKNPFRLNICTRLINGLLGYQNKKLGKVIAVLSWQTWK